MNFKNFLLTVLGNQKGNLDLGSSEETHDSEADNQDSGEDFSTENLLAELGSEDGTESETESQPETELDAEGELLRMLRVTILVASQARVRNGLAGIIPVEPPVYVRALRAPLAPRNRSCVPNSTR